MKNKRAKFVDKYLKLVKKSGLIITCPDEADIWWESTHPGVVDCPWEIQSAEGWDLDKTEKYLKGLI